MPRPSTEDRRAVWSWCLYDFANSPFTTLVVTFVYATFFANVAAADHYLAAGVAGSDAEARALGTSLWARGVTITALAVAALSPFMGALADRGGLRKSFLLGSTAIAVAGSAALYFITPDRVFVALAAFVVANIAFEMGMVFYNAFLPDIALPERIGRVSGFGWGLGYLGGLLALVVALVTLVQPEVPWFGVSTENGENIRATNLLVAIWFVVFSLPVFLWVEEDKSRVSKPGKILKDSCRQIVETFSEIRKYRQVVRFLLARLVYNDGLVTIFAFGGIYAAGTFGFTFSEILVFGIVLNVTAGLGAVAMGFLDDRIGGKKTIQLSIVALAAATLIAVLAPSKPLFWLAGILIGIFSGPNQASSRSLMGRFVPPDKENEFFGFFAFSGKATAFMGPALLGFLTARFGSQRLGVAIVLFFFVLGSWLLSRVDEDEGKAARLGTLTPNPSPRGRGL
jgi:UMF1 family MFS transporter